jgi:hypothetical protein
LSVFREPNKVRCFSELFLVIDSNKQTMEATALTLTSDDKGKHSKEELVKYLDLAKKKTWPPVFEFLRKKRILANQIPLGRNYGFIHHAADQSEDNVLHFLINEIEVSLVLCTRKGEETALEIAIRKGAKRSTLQLLRKAYEVC